MGEEASGREVRGRGTSDSVRVGIRATGGRVVYRTTRAEQTSSPLGGRRGRDRFWLSDGLAIPSIPKERHAEVEDYGGRYEVALIYIVCLRLRKTL